MFYLKRLTQLSAASATAYYALALNSQAREDLKGTLRSVLNAARAVPCVSLCVADYMYSLRGLEYKSD